MIRIETMNHETDWHMIRQCVFVEEQGFENEFDDIDKIAHQVVLYVDQNAVGCGRVYADETGSLWHLGRLAILSAYRKAGYGAIIIEHLEAYVTSQKGSEIILSAQKHAILFYQKQGYASFGDLYMDEHVPHQNMRKYV